MDLDDLRARRARVAAAQSHLEWFERVVPGDVEVRTTDGWEAPTGAEYSVAPTAKGWVAHQWYSEFGGTHSIASVTASSESAALDWVWFTGASAYLAAWVRPAAEQRDVDRRRIARMFGPMGVNRFVRESFAAAAVVPWSDAATRRGALRRAALRSTGADAVRIARNLRTPGDALRRLAERDEDAVRWQVAGNPATPSDVVDRFRREDDFGVRWHLTLRPEVTTAEIVAWSHQDPALWSAVLDRPDLTARQLTEVDLASSGALRKRVVAHPAAGGELLARAVAEADAVLGVALLRSGRLEPRLQDELVERAVGWEPAWVRSALGQDRIPLDRVDRARLGGAEAAEQHRMLALAAEPDPRALAAFAEDASSHVRALLASRADVPLETQRRLAMDPSVDVQMALARNRDADGGVLLTLARNGLESVRDEALRNDAMPVEALRVLADDGGPLAEAARRKLTSRSQRPS